MLALLDERERNGTRVRLFVSQSLEGWNDPARVAALHQHLPAVGISRGNLALEFRHEEARTQLRALIDLSLGLREMGIKLSLAGVDREAVSAGLLEHLPLDFIKLAPGAESVGPELIALVKRRTNTGDRSSRRAWKMRPTAVRLCAAGVDFLQGNFVQQAGQALDYDFNSAQQ